MNYKIVAMGLLIACAACTKAQDTTGNVLDTAGNETSATFNNLRDVFDVGKKPAEKVQSQPRYCYQTYQDVLCYSHPIAGEDYRLVGWQDANGHAGYTLPDGKVYAPKTKPDAAKKPDKGAAAPPDAKPAAIPTSNTVTIQSRTVGTGSVASSANTPTSAKPELKEIIFDPSELEPKQLVPDKAE